MIMIMGMITKAIWRRNKVFRTTTLISLIAEKVGINMEGGIVWRKN